MSSSIAPLSILVVLPNNLGDVIMATPVLEGLRAKHPDARLTFLVEDGFEEPLDGCPFVDEVIMIPRKRIRNLLVGESWHAGQSELASFVALLKARGFSRIINLSQARYIARLVTLTGCHDIKGHQFLAEGNFAIPDPWTRYLFAIPFARSCNRFHAVDIYRRIAGVSTHRGTYTLVLSETERTDAREFLKAHGVDFGLRQVVFQPGAAFASKRWPREHFVELGRLLLADGWGIVISGSRHEKEIADAIAAQLGSGAVSIAGKVSFRLALASCSLMQACVTPDTALMHAAAAFSVPVFALFGTTSPLETGPYGSGHTVFSAGCTQRPCFCTECKSMLCMKSILPLTVYGSMCGKESLNDRGCDRYRTVVEPNGDYVLEPLFGSEFAYTDSANACLTSRAFEPAAESCAGFDSDGVDKSVAVLKVLDTMVSELEAFGRDGSLERIRAFEKGREACSAVGGIADFWCALLNLHLNSIPLLDARQGIFLSLDACLDLAGRIRAAIGMA